MSRASTVSGDTAKKGSRGNPHREPVPPVDTGAARASLRTLELARIPGAFGRAAVRLARLPGRICLATAIVAAVSAAPAVSADQTDPRLPELFDRLADAPSPGEASAVEQAIWRAWLEVEGERPKRLLSAGMTSMSAGELQAAISEFDALVEAAPDFAEGWNKRATAYYLADRLAESVRDIQRTLALEPRHFGALSGMGLILLRTGDRAGALKAFEAVLDVHPQSPHARAQVERLRRELGTPA